MINFIAPNKSTTGQFKFRIHKAPLNPSGYLKKLNKFLTKLLLVYYLSRRLEPELRISELRTQLLTLSRRSEAKKQPSPFFQPRCVPQVGMRD